MTTLDIWQRCEPLPLGKWLFARFFCIKAPYFGTISPRFEALSAGCCRVRMRKRRAVLNHLNSVHAIAMCNLAEAAGGTMTEVTVPATHRWIPKGMTVEYLNKVTTDLLAIATPAADFDWQQRGEYPVHVATSDTHNTVVFRATITMWISVKH